MERSGGPRLLQAPIPVQTRGIIPVPAERLQDHAVAKIPVPIHGPVADMRKAKPDTSCRVVDRLNELDRPGIVLAADIESSQVVVVGEKLREREPGIVARVSIFRPELPGVWTVGFEVLRLGCLPKPTCPKRSYQSLCA